MEILFSIITVIIAGFIIILFGITVYALVLILMNRHKCPNCNSNRTIQTEDSDCYGEALHKCNKCNHVFIANSIE